jgi:hypothetical protein
MLDTYWIGKTTKMRQNLDTSTPPACIYLPHITEYGETRRALAPPGTGS